MTQKIYLFMGIQGSGKGTQAKRVSEKLKLAHISTGDLLRETTGKLAKEISAYIDDGKMVSDELILKILKKRISKADCKNGIILDGYPRNIKQAKTLDSKFDVNKIIKLHISDRESIKRLSGRYTCPKCKAGYNMLTVPKPKKKGICDKCGEKLIQRDDDHKTAIKRRIKDYHKKTKPILAHYKNKIIKINGLQSIEQITKDILSKLK